MQTKCLKSDEKASEIRLGPPFIDGSSEEDKTIYRMAHWFHRNPLKATAPQDFNLKMVSHDVEAIKVRSSVNRHFDLRS